MSVKQTTLSVILVRGNICASVRGKVDNAVTTLQCGSFFIIYLFVARSQLRLANRQ